MNLMDFRIAADAFTDSLAAAMSKRPSPVNFPL